jgi:hypothetical protein
MKIYIKFGSSSFSLVTLPVPFRLVKVIFQAHARGFIHVSTDFSEEVTFHVCVTFNRDNFRF